MKSTRHATIMLLVVTCFWSLSFPLVKEWQQAASESLGDELLASVTLIALRMLPGLLILVLWKHELVRGLKKRELLAGVSLGLVFFMGFTLQVWGMAMISPTLSAFLTSLASAWAPLLGWACLGIRIPPISVLGLILAVAGTVVLGLKPDEEYQPSAGVLLTIASSLLFAVQLVLLDRLGRKMRGETLTIGFFGVAGMLGLGMALARAASGIGIERWAEWVVTQHSDPEVMLRMALLIALPTVLAFHWMNVYQPIVGPTRAALIYLLEPVFTALISVPWGLDTVSASLVAGGTLIVAGNGLVELRGRGRLQP